MIHERWVFSSAAEPQGEAGGEGGGGASLDSLLPPTGEGEGAPGSGDGDGGKGEAGEAVPDWAATASSENQAIVLAKKWGDLDAVIRSYSGLEAKMGGGPDGLIRIPGVDATEEQIAEYRTALGVPANAEGYEFAEVDLQEGEVDLRKPLAEWSLDLGFTAEQASKLFDKVLVWQGEVDQAQAEQLQAENTAAAERVKSRWAAEHDENVHTIRLGMDALGFNAETYAAMRGEMGYEPFMDKMLALSTALGQHKASPGGGEGSFGEMTPQQAQDKLTAYDADPAWQTAYLAGDQAKQKERMALQRIVSGGKTLDL